MTWATAAVRVGVVTATLGVVAIIWNASQVLPKIQVQLEVQEKALAAANREQKEALATVSIEQKEALATASRELKETSREQKEALAVASREQKEALSAINNKMDRVQRMV